MYENSHTDYIAIQQKLETAKDKIEAALKIISEHNPKQINEHLNPASEILIDVILSLEFGKSEQH